MNAAGRPVTDAHLHATVNNPDAPPAAREWAREQLSAHRGHTNPAFGWVLVVALGILSGAAGAVLVWAIDRLVHL